MSRYFELFGSPEKAAKTLKAIERACTDGTCNKCPIDSVCGTGLDNFEWLREQTKPKQPASRSTQTLKRNLQPIRDAKPVVESRTTSKKTQAVTEYKNDLFEAPKKKPKGKKRKCRDCTRYNNCPSGAMSVCSDWTFNDVDGTSWPKLRQGGKSSFKDTNYEQFDPPNALTWDHVQNAETVKVIKKEKPKKAKEKAPVTWEEKPVTREALPKKMAPGNKVFSRTHEEGIIISANLSQLTIQYNSDYSHTLSHATFRWHVGIEKGPESSPLSAFA